MLSIATCKAILEQDGASYTDEEVKEIRDLLYQFGYIDYASFKEQLQEEESSLVHSGIDRGTGASGV
jgi:hypothetical protein